MGKQVATRLKQNNFNIPNGGVAQLGEHLPCKQGVKSSNLSISIRRSESGGVVLTYAPQGRCPFGRVQARYKIKY